MAQKTSTQSGNWSDGSTWGGTAPVAGDSFTINNAAHVVTVTADATVGDGGTTANIVKGTLIVNSGATLTNNSHLYISNTSGAGVFTLNAGATLDMSGGAYDFKQNTDYGGTTATNFLGTPGNRCFVKGGTGRFYHDKTTGGNTYNWSYCTITGFTAAAGNTVNGYVSMTIDHCLFKDTIKWTIGILNVGDVPYVFTNNDIRNCTPISTRMWEFNRGNVVATKTVSISGNTWVGTSTTAMKEIYVAGGTFKTTALADNNVVYNAVWKATVFQGSMTGNIGYHSDPAGQSDCAIFDVGYGNLTITNLILGGNSPNTHGLAASTTGNDGPILLKDSLFELYSQTAVSTSNMMCIGGAINVTVQNNIFIGSGNACHAGIWASSGSLTIINNTMYCNSVNPNDPALSYEFANMRTGYTKFSSNLVIDKYAGTSYPFSLVGGSATVPATVNEADYNGYKGPNSEALSKYNYCTNAATLGMHDIAGDPQCVDMTRTLGSYAHSLNPALSTLNDFMIEVAKRNGFDVNGNAATFTPGFDATSAINWIKAGFTPTNPIFKGTGESGVDIGAVPVYVAAVSWARGRKFGFFTRRGRIE